MLGNNYSVPTSDPYEELLINDAPSSDPYEEAPLNSYSQRDETREQVELIIEAEWRRSDAKQARRSHLEAEQDQHRGTQYVPLFLSLISYSISMLH